MKLLCAWPTAMLLFVVPAAGQEAARVSVFGFGGVTLLNVTEAVDEVCDGQPCPTFHLRARFDTSPLAGVAIGYAVAPRSHVELALSAAPFHHLKVRAEADVFAIPIEVERDLAAYHLTATLRRELGGNGARPFLSAGFGRVEYVQRDDLRLDAPAGDWAVLLGGGLTFGLGSRVRGRVEMVDHVVLDQFMRDDIAHDVHLRLGVSFGL